MKKITLLVAAVAFGLGVHNASAVINSWVNWTGAPASYTNPMTGPFGTEYYATLATGTLYDPNTSQTVNISYTGEVYSASEFNNPSGTDWFNYPATYGSAAVTTLPPAGNFIAVTGFSGQTNTITFSAPVTNLLMAIGSLGNASTPNTLVFSQPASIISQGAGLYGSGPLTMLNSTTLQGLEGNGMIQFSGTFSSLSWTIPDPEQYMVYNIGISDFSATAAVPEPGTWAAAALLAGGAAFARWRKRAKTA